MLNDDDEGDRKPSFGTSLERFRAGPTSPSPSRCSPRLRSKRGSDTLTVKTSIKCEPDDISTGSSRTHVATAVKQERQSDLLSNLKTEIDGPFESVDSQQSNSPSSHPIAPHTPRSAKKRKVYDEKQFEGMKGIPDRIDYDLDSEDPPRLSHWHCCLS